MLGLKLDEVESESIVAVMRYLQTVVGRRKRIGKSIPK